MVESPSGVTLTFGELAGRAHQIVHAIRAQGLAAGDIVAYALPNGVDMVWWQLAFQESGIHGISLNPSLSAREVRAIVDHAGADGIVIDAQLADLAHDLESAESVRLKVAVGGTIDGHVAFDDLVAGHPTTAPDDRTFGAPIVYSSGTTGAPKAIDRNITGVDDPSARADSMKLFGRAFQFEPLSGVHLVSAGMHHGGCQSFYQGALNAGHALAILGKFEPEQTLAAIERNRVTTAYMVPTQFVRMLRLPDDVKQRYDLSSLQVVVHSAAPCPMPIKQQMMDWWGPVIWETYGGMEGAATIAKPQRWLEKPGTVGRSVNGMSVKILDDDGNESARRRRQGLPRTDRADVPVPRRRRPDRVGASRQGLHPRRRGLPRRRRLPLPARPRQGHDHQRRRQHLPGRGRSGADPASGRRRRRGDRFARRRVGRVGARGRVADAGNEPSDALAEELIGVRRERLAKYKCPRTVEFRAELPAHRERQAVEATAPRRAHRPTPSNDRTGGLSMTTTSEEFEKATDFSFKEEDIDAAKALVGMWTGSTRQEYITQAGYDNMRNFARGYGDDNPLYRPTATASRRGGAARSPPDAADRDEPTAA